MTDSTIGSFNLQRADIVIKTLLSLGVRYFCVAPGSRSTPLMIAISRLPKEYRCVHFDERGLGFLALGFAKASKTPVVILTTSGTAVANLLPAVIEAHLSKVPLIILSADRPPELRDCGANQTVDQVKMFSSFASWEIDLAFSDPLCPHEYITSSIAYGLKRSLEGPVQINCMIREPLFSLEKPQHIEMHPCTYEPIEKIAPMPSFVKWAEMLSSHSKGVIILGSEALSKNEGLLLTLAKKLNWPIFSDILSGGRKIGENEFHMQYPDIFLKAFPDIQVEAVLHIGNRITSKTIAEWLKRQKKAAYFQVTNNPHRQDPLNLVSWKMDCQPELFLCLLNQLLPTLETPKHSPWLFFWQHGSQIIQKEIQEFFLRNKTFSEPAIMYCLQKSPHLFFSNSMPIRDADLFLFPKEGIAFTAGNRGASGIDGNIATAVGIALALKKPLVAVLGDLAALHDLNSLALIKNCPVPITFIIINNQGGGIFSFLPISEEKDLFEEFVAAAHEYSFDNIAKTFSIPFFYADSWDSWSLAIKEQKSCIIECRTSRKENVHHHETIYAKVKEKLCSSTAFLEALRNSS